MVGVVQKIDAHGTLAGSPGRLTVLQAAVRRSRRNVSGAAPEQQSL